MEGGGGIGQFERDEQPPFRGEFPGFIKLVLREEFAKFAWTPRTTQAENRGIPFHTAILQGNLRSVTSKQLKGVALLTRPAGDQSSDSPDKDRGQTSRS